MTRQLASLILCGGFTVLAAACATKSFVQKQVSATESKLVQQVSATETKLSQEVSATETKLTERVDTQETQLRETADRAGASRQAIDATDQRLKGLDTRVGEVGELASGAQTRADLAAVAVHDAEARLSQRLASRNKYRLLETRSIYFESGHTEIRSQDINALEDVAKALKADANAVSELQGFADPRGSDRYNNELARERVEAVVRYLVQRHGIELRQVRAVSMGKVALVAGEKPGTEALARARRVDIRLLAPWSSWEDAQTQIDQAAPAQAATNAPPASLESAQPPPATTVVPPAQPESTEPMQAGWVEPAQAGAASPAIIEPDQPARPRKISPRSGRDGDERKNDAPGRALLEILKTISPEDLGGK